MCYLCVLRLGGGVFLSLVYCFAQLFLNKAFKKIRILRTYYFHILFTCTYYFLRSRRQEQINSQRLFFCFLLDLFRVTEIQHKHGYSAKKYWKNCRDSLKEWLFRRLCFIHRVTSIYVCHLLGVIYHSIWLKKYPYPVLKLMETLKRFRSCVQLLFYIHNCLVSLWKCWGKKGDLFSTLQMGLFLGVGVDLIEESRCFKLHLRKNIIQLNVY